MRYARCCAAGDCRQRHTAPISRRFFARFLHFRFYGFFLPLLAAIFDAGFRR